MYTCKESALLLMISWFYGVAEQRGEMHWDTHTSRLRGGEHHFPFVVSGLLGHMDVSTAACGERCGEGGWEGGWEGGRVRC